MVPRVIPISTPKRLCLVHSLAVNLQLTQYGPERPRVGQTETDDGHRLIRTKVQKQDHRPFYAVSKTSRDSIHSGKLVVK